MNIQDKLDAARHSLTGSNISKIASKASSREIMGPKKKHIDYLVQCTHEDNVSIPNLADILFERCTNSSWVVVFKALVTFHHLMSYGNERFIQYLASRTSNFNLQNFLDKSGLQGVDMSNFIRRYSVYLNEKASSYMEAGYDFCRVKRGKEDGVLRTMDQTKLLKALPIMQKLLDSLLSVEITTGELNNGVVNSAFLMLFKDLIRLFACYNDGIINLLEKYFDMPKKSCKEALDIYKKFLFRMDKVSEFLKVAEDVGINKGDIPDLTKAPNSLLEALENHLHSLEKGNKPSSQPPKTITLPPISVPSFSTSSDVFGSVTGSSLELSKQQLIEEEARHLEAFKVQHMQKQSTQPSPQQNVIAPPLMPPPSNPASASQQQNAFTPQQQQNAFAPQQQQQNAFTPQQQQNAFTPQQQQNAFTPQQDAFAPQQSSPSSNPVPAPNAATPAQSAAATSLQDDLMQLGQVFSAPQSSAQQMSFTSSQSAPSGFQPAAFQQPVNMMPGWGATVAMPNQGMQPPFGFSDNSFSTNFSNSMDSGQVLGDVLQPTVPGKAPNASSPTTPSDASQVKGNDLNSSLARVAWSLDNMNLSQQVKPAKDKHQWTPSAPSVKTGGSNWQAPTVARSTLVAPASMQPGMGQPMFGAQAFQQPRMPGTFPQPGMTSPQGVPMGAMFPQQPFQQQAPVAQDPFGPVPGTQARF